MYIHFLFKCIAIHTKKGEIINHVHYIVVQVVVTKVYMIFYNIIKIIINIKRDINNKIVEAEKSIEMLIIEIHGMRSTPVFLGGK